MSEHRNDKLVFDTMDVWDVRSWNTVNTRLKICSHRSNDVLSNLLCLFSYFLSFLRDNVASMWLKFLIQGGNLLPCWDVLLSNLYISLHICIVMYEVSHILFFSSGSFKLFLLINIILIGSWGFFKLLIFMNINIVACYHWKILQLMGMARKFCEYVNRCIFLPTLLNCFVLKRCTPCYLFVFLAFPRESYLLLHYKV